MDEHAQASSLPANGTSAPPGASAARAAGSLEVPGGKLVLPPGAPSEQWHATRATGICGSDLAAILGRSPFSTPAKVYLDKTGMHRDITGPDPLVCPIFWGTALEDAVADAWARVTGIEVWRTGTYAHHTNPWQLGNPDRIGDGFGLEVKTTDARNAPKWDPERVPGGVPFWYYCQVQHYMHVTGLPYFWVICLIGGNQLAVRKVEADPEDHETLTEVEDRFWHDHVLARRAPLVDYQDAKLMSALYPARKASAIDLDQRAVAKLARHRAAKDELTTLNDEITALEVDLKNTMGHNEIGRIGGKEALRYKATARIDKHGVPVRVFSNRIDDVLADWQDYVNHDPDLDPARHH